MKKTNERTRYELGMLLPLLVEGQFEVLEKHLVRKLSEENPYSQFLMMVMGGVNQLERDLIRMRQREGIDLAKKDGKYPRRVKKYHHKHVGINYATKLYREDKMTVKQICEITNVSWSALYRRLSEVGNK